MTDRHHPPTRFLVPGFSQTADVWNAAARGLGNTDPLEIPEAASFVETAHALAAGRTGVWAGYSLGGRLALQVAVDRPQAVSGLILLSTTPGIADRAERDARYASDLELADWIEHHTVEEFLDRWLAQPLLAGSTRSRHHRLSTSAGIAAQLRTLSQGAQLPLWDHLSTLAMPVRVVAGADDHKYSTIAHAMVDKIGTNAELHIAPGVGHPLLELAPDLVRGWLGEL